MIKAFWEQGSRKTKRLFHTYPTSTTNIEGKDLRLYSVSSALVASRGVVPRAANASVAVFTYLLSVCGFALTWEALFDSAARLLLVPGVAAGVV